MTLTWIGFAVFFMGTMLAPRLAMAVLVFSYAENPPAYLLAACALVMSNEQGKKEFFKHVRYAAEVAHAWLTGKPLIVEKVRIVEKEKIVTVEKEKIVRHVIKVKEMSSADAYQALGCAPGANRAQIESGYREIMKKVHPDHGGSVYLAALVNQARGMLIK